MATKKKTSPKRGRPALSNSERVTSVNTTVKPDTRDYLERIGDGSASKGARLVLAWAANNNLHPGNTTIPRES